MTSIELIVLAMFAGFIILRLRGELGNKTGNEPNPPHMNDPAHPKHNTYNGTDDVDGTYDQVENNVIPLEGDPELRSAFKKIHAADHSFNLDNFLHGAKTVYQMVLESFWQGDRDSLRTYLSNDVYNQFEGAITAREEAGHHLENKILDIVGVDVIEASIKNKVAEISVHFKTEIVAVTRDKDGKAIDGNMSDAVTLNDKWTFTHDMGSNDPSWLLVATRAG